MELVFFYCLTICNNINLFSGAWSHIAHVLRWEVYRNSIYIKACLRNVLERVYYDKCAFYSKGECVLKLDQDITGVQKCVVIGLGN